MKNRSLSPVNYYVMVGIGVLGCRVQNDPEAFKSETDFLVGAYAHTHTNNQFKSHNKSRFSATNRPVSFWNSTFIQGARVFACRVKIPVLIICFLISQFGHFCGDNFIYIYFLFIVYIVVFGWWVIAKKILRFSYCYYYHVILYVADDRFHIFSSYHLSMSQYSFSTEFIDPFFVECFFFLLLWLP